MSGDSGTTHRGAGGLFARRELFGRDGHHGVVSVSLWEPVPSMSRRNKSSDAPSQPTQGDQA